VCCGEEGFRAAECAQAELSPVLDTIEHALDNVARFVEFGVVFELHLAVLAGRDAGGCLGLVQPVAQVIGVIATVRDNGAPFRDIWFKALARLGNIGSVSRCQPQVNRATAAIADQMQFAVQPAFGLADAPSARRVFLTPLAAIRWALTWLASIISVERSAASRASASKIRSKTPASDQRFQRL